MTDKKIRIGVDSSEAQGFQSQIRREAESLAKEMIRSARSYSTSSKEVIKDIEEQIKAIEKRNKLDAEFAKTRLDLNKGSLSSNQYSSASSKITSGYNQDQIQTKLLRELIDTIKFTSKELIDTIKFTSKEEIDTIKFTSKEEIREDRKGVYERISKSRTVGKLGVSGDELGSLKETIQQDLISDLNGQEQGQKRGFNVGRVASGAARYGGMVSQGNVGGAMMSGGGSMMSGVMSNPVLGIAAAALLIAGFSSIQNRNIGNKLRDYSLTTGTSSADLFGSNGKVSSESRNKWGRLGLTPVEVLKLKGGFTKSFGGEMNEWDANQSIGVTRSTAISTDQMNKAISVSRYSSSNSGSPTTEIAILQRYLEENNKSLAQLPEILDSYLNISTQILSRTGEVDTLSTARTIASIGQNYGVSGSNLSRFTQAFQGGFSRSSNPQIQALQFQTMGELNPNSSLWDLQTKLQSPLEQEGYIGSMIEKVKSMYGGSEQGKFTLQSMLGDLGGKDIDKIWSGGTKGYKPTKVGETAVGYLGAGEKFTSATESLAKTIEGGIEKVGAVAGAMPENIKKFFESPAFSNLLSGAFKEGLTQAKATDPSLFK